MAEFDKLVKQVSKAAQNMGGLIAILLAVKAHKTQDVQWDPSKAQFIVNGKAIPLKEIQKELGRIELKIAATIISYNNKLWNHEWTVTKWRAEMDKLIQDNHILLGALAVGGIVAAAKDATVLRRIDRDTKALGNFKTAIKTKSIPSLPMIQSRGRTYIRSLYVTYHLLNQRIHIAAGYKWAKRILTPSEHCHTKNDLAGCYETAARSWILIRDMPPIGTLVCRQFCKCYIIYSR